MIELDPTISRDRQIIVHGNVRVWGEAVKLQGARIMDADTTQIQRHIDAAFFAIALLRFQESVRRAIREFGNDQLKDAFKRYKHVSPNTREIRNALHYILDNSLALPSAQKKSGIPADEWRVVYERSRDNFVIRVASKYELSVAKTSAATDAILGAL